jgi:hypothetical protein
MCPRQRHHRLSGPLCAHQVHRRQMAEGDRIRQRLADRPPRAGRLDSRRSIPTGAASRGTSRSADMAPAARRTSRLQTPVSTSLRAARIAYQMHYTSSRQAVTDKTQGGLLLLRRNSRPTCCVRPASPTSRWRFRPGAERHPETAYMEFPDDAHFDLRRAAALPLALLLDQARIRYPDGSKRRCC